MSLTSKSALAIVLSMLLSLPAMCAAEETAKVKIEFKVKAPDGTPADAKLYLAGNVKELGDWKADGVELKKQDDGQYSATLSVAKGSSLEFKITRGNWDTVEKKADGNELDNRKHTAEKDETVKLEVAKWAK